MNGFSSGDVVRLTGLPFRTLDHWARTGFITPSVAQTTGTGTPRQYSLPDLITVIAAKHLRAAGVTTAHIKRLLAADSNTLENGYVTVTIDKAAIARDLAKLGFTQARKADA